MKFEVDRDRHIYTLDGKRVPSVTTVLNLVTADELARIPPKTLEAARVFGTNVHAAVDLFNRGQLDEDTLDAPLVPYLDGWKKFLAESGAVVIASELAVYHPILRYAGTEDVVLDWGGRIV